MQQKQQTNIEEVGGNNFHAKPLRLPYRFKKWTESLHFCYIRIVSKNFSILKSKEVTISHYRKKRNQKQNFQLIFFPPCTFILYDRAELQLQHGAFMVFNPGLDGLVWLVHSYWVFQSHQLPRGVVNIYFHQTSPISFKPPRSVKSTSVGTGATECSCSNERGWPGS